MQFKNQRPTDLTPQNPLGKCLHCFGGSVKVQAPHVLKKIREEGGENLLCHNNVWIRKVIQKKEKKKKEK